MAKEPTDEFYHGGKGIAMATAAAVALGTSYSPFPDLEAGLRRGDVVLYLSVPNMADIDISQMQPHQRTVLETMRLRERLDKSVPPVAVHVASGMQREVCQIYLTAEELHRLSQVPVPLLSSTRERLADAIKICSGNRVVPDSVDPRVMENKPYSVVAPEGRVAMQPLTINKLTLS